jgi:benzaldehyde dehydrogenase (NAD)
MLCVSVDVTPQHKKPEKWQPMHCSCRQRRGAKIYSNGWWEPGLGTAEATEKATGAKLGEISVASAEDAAAAAAAARVAQKEWAKLPGPQRGDVLREVSRLLLVHTDEIADQLIRETGSIRAKAQ